MEPLNFIASGRGEPLVFQHGLTANINQITDLLKEVQNVRLLSFDCPGHGHTSFDPTYPVSFDSFSDAIVSMLDGLGINKARFGGISMGSGIAINIALRYPEKVSGLILVRPAWLDVACPDSLSVILEAANCMKEKEGKSKFLTFSKFLDIQKEVPGAATSILNIFSDEQHHALDFIIKKMVDDRPFHDIRSLEDISVPTLIIGNDDDPVHPFHMAEEIHNRIRGSILKKVTSRYIDHYLHVSEVKTAITEFINET